MHGARHGGVEGVGAVAAAGQGPGRIGAAGVQREADPVHPGKADSECRFKTKRARYGHRLEVKRCMVLQLLVRGEEHDGGPLGAIERGNRFL